MNEQARKVLALMMLLALIAACIVFFVIYKWDDIISGNFIKILRTDTGGTNLALESKKSAEIKPEKLVSEKTPPISQVLPEPKLETSTSSAIEKIATTTATEILAPEIATTSVIVPKFVLFDVPFTSQAPSAKWKDPRYKYGCEESASLMAIRFAEGKELTLPSAEQEIIAIAEFQRKKYGEFRDTSAQDILNWIIQDYFKFTKATLVYGIGVEDIKNELIKGNILIVPVNGTRLKNPYYTQSGPLHHAIVIKGFDEISREFITNDPGTRRGNSYRYSYDRVQYALMDYPTGRDESAPAKLRTAMIVISPQK